MHTDTHNPTATDDHDFEDDWLVWQEMAAENEPAECAPDGIDEWIEAIAQELQ